MKRWIWRILVFLLLGAAINVAVAWICAARSESLRYDGMDYRRATRADLPEYLSVWWPPPVQFGEARGQGFGTSQTEVVCSDLSVEQLAEAMGKWKEGPLRAIHTRMRFGWPFRSMYYDQPGVQGALSKEAKAEFFRRCESGAGTRFFKEYPRWVPIASGSRRGMPRGVLPLGFALNAAMCGSIVGVLCLPAFILRIHFRRRRNLCQRCAYPIGTSPVCTECGRPVKPRAKASV